MREHGSGIDGPTGFLKTCTWGWRGHLGVSWVYPQPWLRTSPAPDVDCPAAEFSS